MKKINCKMLIMVAFAAAISFQAKAQDLPAAILENPKYGNTPEERKESAYEINYFTDDYNNKNFESAAVRLQKILQKAPGASQNVYIRGINIYRTKAAKAASVAEKTAMVDTLMMLYDKRIEFFGEDPQQKSDLAGMKARDFMANKPSDKEGIRKLFNEAIELGGENVDLDLINIYFKDMVDEYKADELETEVLMTEYERLGKIFDGRADSDANKAEAKNTFDALFISSGAANCENLIKVYQPKVEADPTNVELVEKAFNLLSRNNCKEDYVIQLGESYYKLKPSSAVALGLAASFEAKGDFVKSKEYLNEAIATETDPTMKAKLAIQIAGGELHQKNPKAAAEYAKQAIDIDPSNPLAYYTLAAAYIEGRTGCADFARQAVCWLAADVLAKAKDLAANDADMSGKISALLSSCSAGFPTNEECFFRGLDSGSTYTVSCGWISGSTRVRTVR